VDLPAIVPRLQELALWTATGPLTPCAVLALSPLTSLEIGECDGFRNIILKGDDVVERAALEWKI